MTPERWQHVEEIFQAALDRPPQERAAFFAEACPHDDELKREASSLIEAYEQAGDFIEDSALEHDAGVLLGHQLTISAGRQIDRYTVIDRIGRGGMAEVYLAHDERLDRNVALKILPNYFVADELQLRRFQVEARAASALNHTNIITIFDVGQSDGIRFIATEYIEGRDLRELLAGPELKLNEVIDLMAQMLGGLVAAHAAGIVHRDIKPENIMVRNDGVVKILDFGVAKLLERNASLEPVPAHGKRAETEVGVIVGTIGYMSPEQLHCLPVDHRTDIWSAGVVLYELLTRQSPFAGVSRADTIAAILEREPPALSCELGARPQVMLALRRVAERALQKDRDQRYQDAAEMLADLRRIETAELTGVSVPADLVSLNPPRASQRLLSTRRLVPVAIATILAVAAVFMYRQLAVKTASADDVPPVVTRSYKQMSTGERLAFINQQQQRVSAMMGDRPAKIDDASLHRIKAYVDHYAERINGVPPGSTAETLNAAFQRAAPQVPKVARPFAERRIPIVVGIYLPMIESAYQPCVENSIGAKGLFQFMPQTAEHYGVSRGEMCDVDKMSLAAARYIADRMAEMGDDSQSMTLVLLSFNRGDPAVRDALRRMREVDNTARRDFWTLFANREKLAGSFREEAGYVHAFFAAAIIGENPITFDLPTPPLTSLAGKP